MTCRSGGQTDGVARPASMAEEGNLKKSGDDSFESPPRAATNRIIYSARRAVLWRRYACPAAPSATRQLSFAGRA
jgi:hypothetical protein